MTVLVPGLMEGECYVSTSWRVALIMRCSWSQEAVDKGSSQVITTEPQHTIPYRYKHMIISGEVIY